MSPSIIRRGPRRGVRIGKRRPTSGGKKGFIRRPSRTSKPRKNPRSISREDISSLKNKLSKQIKQSGNRSSTSRKERSSLENKLSKQIKQSRKDSRRVRRQRPERFGRRRGRRVRRRR